MSRAKILEDTLARLEAERYHPTPPRRRSGEKCDPLPPVTREQGLRNQRILLEAISDDPTVVAWRERQAS